MNQAEQVHKFEETVLSYTEMCFGVALALTRNLDKAQDLTREILTWAWCQRGSQRGRRNIKMKMMAMLRKRFMQLHDQTPYTIKSERLADTVAHDLSSHDIPSGLLHTGAPQTYRAANHMLDMGYDGEANMKNPLNESYSYRTLVPSGIVIECKQWVKRE